MRKVTAFLYYVDCGTHYEIASFYCVTAKGDMIRLIAPEHVAPYKYLLFRDVIKSAENILRANDFYVWHRYDFGAVHSGIICLKVPKDFHEEPQTFFI